MAAASKQKSHELYAWTRDYLQNVGAYRDGGRAGDTEPKSAAEKLSEIMGKHGWDQRAYLSGLGNFLPGVSAFVLTGENKKVFDFTNGELASFEQKRRLGSPSHWRQYFAFDVPSYALKDSEITLFRDACIRSGASGATILKQIFQREHERPGHYVDLLLDRLLDLPTEAISTKEIDGMISAFVATMDGFAGRLKSSRIKEEANCGARAAAYWEKQNKQGLHR